MSRTRSRSVALPPHGGAVEQHRHAAAVRARALNHLPVLRQALLVRWPHVPQLEPHEAMDTVRRAVLCVLCALDGAMVAEFPRIQCIEGDWWDGRQEADWGTDDRHPRRGEDDENQVSPCTAHPCPNVYAQHPPR